MGSSEETPPARDVPKIIRDTFGVDLGSPPMRPPRLPQERPGSERYARRREGRRRPRRRFLARCEVRSGPRGQLERYANRSAARGRASGRALTDTKPRTARDRPATLLPRRGPGPRGPSGLRLVHRGRTLGLNRRVTRRDGPPGRVPPRAGDENSLRSWDGVSQYASSVQGLSALSGIRFVIWSLVRLEALNPSYDKQIRIDSVSRIWSRSQCWRRRWSDRSRPGRGAAGFMARRDADGGETRTGVGVLTSSPRIRRGRGGEGSEPAGGQGGRWLSPASGRGRTHGRGSTRKGRNRARSTVRREHVRVLHGAVEQT